jgi:photosystem II stability/assembly factor-like uncharacterized protein
MGTRHVSKSSAGCFLLASLLMFVCLIEGISTAEARTLQWSSTKLNLFGDNIGVAVSPDGAFFASDGFHIDRSMNLGSSWQEVTTGASFAGGAIAIDPVNPSIMIAGRGHGLLKSVDGGASWFELIDLNAGPAASDIAFDPQNSHNIYAGVGAGWGLYKSQNGGATWKNLLTSRDVRALAISAVDSQLVYVGTTDYYSTKGGVLRTTDGGANWATVLPNVIVNTLAMNLSNDSVIFAGTEDNGILKSSDRGLTWQNVSGSAIVAPVSKILYHPSHDSVLLAATSGQGAFLSVNHGLTWTPANEGLADLNIVAMAMQSRAPNAVFAATYGGGGFVGSLEIVPEPAAVVLALTCVGMLVMGRP